MENYRTLVLKYDLSRLPPEVAGKIPALLKMQEEFQRWAADWIRGSASLPEHNPLRYFAKVFLHASKMLNWLRGLKKNGIEVKKMRPPLIFDAQLRLSSERDISRGVLVDLPRKEVRIRKWNGQHGNTITLPLSESTARWILDRVREGGRLALAMVWIGRSRRSRAVKLYVALVFRREILPIRPEGLLVIDFNALHNGLAWAVVEGERILKKGVLRLDASKILHLQKIMANLESICAKKGERCDEAMAIESHIWRILREWENRAVRELVRTARKRKAVIVVDIPDDKSMR
jgi:putative transposase